MLFIAYLWVINETWFVSLYGANRQMYALEIRRIRMFPATGY